VSDALTAVVGNDATIVNDMVVTLIAELLDGLDPASALEDFAAKDGGDSDDESAPVIQRVLEALNTPPFIVPARVVVLREVQHVSGDDAEELVRWAGSPTPGVRLLVSSTGGRAKTKIVKSATRVVDVTVGSKAKDRLEFVGERFDAQDVHMSTAVAQQVADRLGDELARADSLARTLKSVYGSAPLTFAQIEPYLGDAGDVPEWDLTDAIDQGRVTQAITTARRMLDSEGRVGVQVVNILQRHYLKMARLEGSGASTGEQAAEIIGGHAFPAQKLVRSARILGPDRIASAIAMVTRADLDLKGGADYGGSRGGVDRTALTVVEVLVARLAKLSEAARRV